MSNCYKCGRELPEGRLECDPFCAEQRSPFMGESEIEKCVEEFERNAYEVDWDAVKTFEDLKLLVIALTDTHAVLRGDKMFPKVRHLLKEKPIRHD